MKRFMLFLLLLPAIAVMAQQTEKTPAFPGAEGFGRYVTGGRGGAVYHVTNLNDSGTGSLRWALSQSGTKTIVFDISGTIHLSSSLYIGSNTTIAGQTAPGDGICLADYPVSISGNNVIVRYMRFRLGNDYVTTNGADGWDGFGSLDCKDLMIDHCSVSWSIDECLSISGCENVTVQWCLVAQSLRHSGHSKGNHGYGGNWGGKNTSFHHNLLAHHESRTPRLGPRPTTQLEEWMDMRNNVIYNWTNNGCYGGEAMKINMVNNYYKPGPGTQQISNEVKRKRIAGLGIRTTEYIETYPAYADAWHIWGRYFIDGNVNASYSDVTNDNWTYGVYNQVNLNGDDCDGTWTAQTQQDIHLDSPLTFYATTTHNAATAYERVLDYAGASLHRDEFDALMVSDTRNGNATYTGDYYEGSATEPTAGKKNSLGIINTPYDNKPANASSSWTPWPALSSSSAPADSDGDGMPDTWEQNNGLNPNDASDGPQEAENGYTNLENYLNSIVATITTAQNSGGTLMGTVEYQSNDIEVDDSYELTAATYEETADGKWLFSNDFSITTSKTQAAGNYSTLKYSAGVEYTINIPNGLAIEGMKIEGYDNYDTNDATLTLSVNGKAQSGTYTFPKDRSTVEHEITFSTMATKTIAFKPAVNQVCLKITLYPVKNHQSAAATQTGAITLPFYDGSTNFAVNYSDEVNGKATASVILGSALGCSNRRTVNNANFNDISTTEKKASAANANNALTIQIATDDETITFKPTSIAFNACKVGTDGGKFDLSLDGNSLISGAEPNRNNENSGWYSSYNQTLSSTAATEHNFVFNIYALDNKTLGLGNIVITGDLTSSATRTVVLKEMARALDVTAGEADVTLHRQLGTTWNTLCLPFSLTASQISAVWGNTEIYAYTGQNGTTMHFSPVEEIEAGVPYLIKVQNVVAKPQFSGVNISALQPQVINIGDYAFAGTYTRYAMAYGGSQLMMKTNGMLAAPTPAPNNWLNGMRAYFVVPVSDSNAAKIDVAGISDDLRSINDSGVILTDNRIYNLKGQLMKANPSQLPSGIYIMNGKKIVIR
ncbi:MAG: hypothetical protein IJM78_03295 [Prevotella sp.]|nr:hypothetical protein [Prevotella sp.]